MAIIKINDVEILSNTRYPLKKINFDRKKKDGTWDNQTREVYEHGNAVTVLLYNTERRTIILIRQFRIATYLNGNAEGTLMEACAGLLDKGESPAEAIKREIKEETGYDVTGVQKVYEAYSSPGALNEKMFFYVAQYNAGQRTGEGGGLEEEGEDVEVIEMSFDEALKLLDNGAIRDTKTIVLLQYAQLKGLLG